MEAFLHESVTLTCQAGGSPPPTIHWLKNGQSIAQDAFTNTPAEQRQEEDDAKAQVLSNSIGLSSTRSRLFLDCLTPQDSAVYTCVAETAYSRINTDTKLIVSGKKDHLIVLRTNYLFFALIINSGPSFIHLSLSRLIHTQYPVYLLWKLVFALRETLISEKEVLY